MWQTIAQFRESRRGQSLPFTKMLFPERGFAFALFPINSGSGNCRRGFGSTAEITRDQDGRFRQRSASVATAVLVSVKSAGTSCWP